MKSEFSIAIKQLAAEKNLPPEVVYQAMEAALVSAYKRDTDLGGNVAVRIDRDSGDHHVYLERTVVQEVADAKIEIGLPEARKRKPDVMPGDVLQDEVHPSQAGRIAAQTAKQVVLQRLREAEREMVFEEFSNREGDIVSGVVQRAEACFFAKLPGPGVNRRVNRPYPGFPYCCRCGEACHAADRLVSR